MSVHEPILNVTVRVENPTNSTQILRLDKGRCFEHLDPETGLQNAVLADNLELIVPPRGQIEATVPAYCLNQYRIMKDKQPANMTGYVLTRVPKDQTAVWKMLNKPGA